MDDKLALRISQAGMRFIAQMTIYNSGNFERLRRFIAESYHPDLLKEEPVDTRLDEFRASYDAIGKVRVRQVIGTGKHQVIVLLEAEQADDYFLGELKVEEDYPHRIIEFRQSAID
jgi:hypothetical protein